MLCGACWRAKSVTGLRLSKWNATTENVSRFLRMMGNEREERLRWERRHDEQLVRPCSSWVEDCATYARLMPHSLILLSRVL